MSHKSQLDEPGIVIGVVKGVRGLHGELRIEKMTDVPNRFDVGNKVFLDQKEYTISSYRYDRNKLFIKLSGIDTRNKSEALTGMALCIRNSDLIELPRGDYFHYQLIGIEVFDENKLYLGTIKEILQTGANDVYVIANDELKDLLIPAISSVIKDVDISAGKMFVVVPKGL